MADNGTYKCVFVQLQDSSGKIARATQDITIGLSSSLTYIGTVESSITILKGETFASADFASTFNPGTTTISASSTGYSTVIASITTVGPIPSGIAIYGFPPTLPADGNSYAAIMVQLQDSSGSPARAPQGGVRVSLTCSDTTIGIVTPVTTILEGQTYATANFTTTTKAQTDAKTESAIITAVSQGYSPTQANITTTPLASNPTKLKIFTGPSNIPADQSSYKQIAIQLQNASGYAAKTQSTDTTLNMASNDSNVCKIDQIKIPAGQTYALATLNTTFKTGSANITAVANDFPLAYQSINTFGFIPSKIAVYCIPTTLPSDGKTYQTLQVQLQDLQGRPAKSTETGVNVMLFSSQPNVGVVCSTLTIPFGQTQATGNLTTTNTPGNTSITAQASGYITGQTTLTSSIIDYYAISSSAGDNGTISPSGNISVILGGSQTYNITVNNGYHIADVFVDNASQGAVSKYTFSNITSIHTIAANFAINTYKLNVTQTSNGVIAPGTTSVNYGDTQTFTIAPDTGYHIYNITANGAPVTVNSTSGQSYQFSSVTANGSLTASFAAYSYAIRVFQTANGTIDPGTTSVNYNSSLTFIITPKTGFQIVDVLANGISVGAVSSYTVQNIQGATTISAVFAPNPTPTSSPTPNPTPTSTMLILTTINATTDNGATVNLAISGNITSRQITDITITRNQSASSTTVSFTVTGESGTTGLGNITIPKTVVDDESIPTVYIDGKIVSNQNFSQDADNYYVWYTTHFSTHEVSIVFKAVSTSPVTTAQTILPQKAIYGIVAAAAISAIISVVFVLKKRNIIKIDFDSIKNFFH